MSLFIHEMRRNRLPLLVWSAVIALFIIVCMLMYPEMKGEMEQLNEMFANMGSFTAAFGMERISFGTPMGFYGVECGNILGIGGAFFAALYAAGALSKEENERTAEFLLTHPVSRGAVVTAKLTAVTVQIVVLNAVSVLCAVISFGIIGESIDMPGFLLFHIALLVMQLELMCLCFCISAFLRRGAMGIGIGIAALMYFLSLFANISEQARFAKYITPFCYAGAQDILTDSRLDATLMLLGALYAVIALAVTYTVYLKKDIAS